MALIVSVANQKGGSGKTTTAQQLATELSTAGYRIHVLDMDPQASLTQWYRIRSRLNIHTFKVESVASGILEDELVAYKQNTDLDIVLVDCPGNIVDITLHVLKYSDVVVCPVRATGIDVTATKSMVRSIEMAREQGSQIRLLVFHNAKHGSRRLDASALEEMVRIFRPGENTFILKTAITDTAAIAEAGMSGKSVREYAPKSDSAKLYLKLTKEILQCLSTTA